MMRRSVVYLQWRRSKGGRKKVVCTNKRHYHAEFDFCLLCEDKLKSRRYLNWRKKLQLLAENLYVTSRGRYCPRHPDITYLSAEAANLSLPGSTYGLDVLVRIAYLRDYYQMSFVKIKEART